jgi:hypothetical protein
LVTSVSHAARQIDIFRKVGWPGHVLSVDYRSATLGESAIPDPVRNR